MRPSPPSTRRSTAGLSPSSWSKSAAMPERASFTTHLVAIGEDEVVKRFRSWDRGEHLREWQALTLLASYAPDLAPAPLSADLTSVPPQVRMSRVPGLPLDRLPLDRQGVGGAGAGGA